MDNSMANGVLVIITSSLCGGCKAFKPNVSAIEKMAKNKGIKFVYYEDQQTSRNEMYRPPPLCPSLGQMAWYPFLFYTDRQTWDSMVKGADKRSHIKVLNGNFNGQTYNLTVGTIPSVEDVSKWLDKNTRNTTVHDNNDWTLQSQSEVLKPTSNKNENNTKMKLVPRRKYGKKK